jgi:hypothetical protein
MAKTQTKKETEWEDNLYDKAREMGIPGCIGLAEYIMKLEQRVQNLEIALTIHTGQENEKPKPKQK